MKLNVVKVVFRIRVVRRVERRGRIKILMACTEGYIERVAGQNNLRLVEPEVSAGTVVRLPEEKIEGYFERVLARLEERFNLHPLADDALCQRLEKEDPSQLRKFRKEWQKLSEELEMVVEECSKWDMRHTIRQTLQLI